MADHNVTGQRGEEIAAAFLKEKGYEILELNWRFKNLEADIIATFESQLIIAEVKTRNSTFFGEPETFVNRQKQKNLIKAANEYVLRSELELEVRFDILSVVSANGRSTVKHIESAFYPLIRK
jgi:putative endonuclease